MPGLGKELDENSKLAGVDATCLTLILIPEHSERLNTFCLENKCSANAILTSFELPIFVSDWLKKFVAITFKPGDCYKEAGVFAL